MKRPKSILAMLIKLWALLLTLVMLAVVSFVVFKPDIELPDALKEVVGDAISDAIGDSELVFRAAEKWVGLGGDTSLYAGTTAQARDLALQYSDAVEHARNAVINYESGSDRSRTFCLLGEGTCVFLVRLPGLEGISPRERDLFHTAAWVAAVEVCEGLDIEFRQIGIGIKARDYYSAVMVGEPTATRPRVERIEDSLIACFKGDSLGTAAQQVARASESDREPESAPKPPQPRRSLPTEMREWEAEDGRALMASLVGFSSDSPPEAVFERDDGKPYTIGLGRFSPASRQEIMAYYDDQ